MFSHNLYLVRKNVALPVGRITIPLRPTCRAIFAVTNALGFLGFRHCHLTNLFSSEMIWFGLSNSTVILSRAALPQIRFNLHT